MGDGGWGIYVRLMMIEVDHVVKGAEVGILESWKRCLSSH